jgi:hypothetical protein
VSVVNKKKSTKLTQNSKLKIIKQLKSKAAKKNNNLYSQFKL